MDLALRLVITLLCGVGLYTSLFMLNKTRRAERGELRERSIVQSPRARIFGGLPNALFGSIYYPALAAAVWLVGSPLWEAAVLSAAGLAAATSLWLGYSLLFITRRPCPYCWTAHAINWSLLPLLVWLFQQSY